MSRKGALALGGAVLGSVGLGVAVWALTDSTTASYIVGVAGLAISAVGLVSARSGNDLGQRLKGKLRLGKVTGSEVTAVETDEAADSATADIKAKDVQWSTIHGVKKKRGR